MNLTTLEKVTARLAKGYEGHLALLNDLIVDVSAICERYLDRTVQTATVTETFDIEESQRIVKLGAWPVTSITSVSNDSSRAFTDFVDDSDYVVDANGILSFDFPLIRGKQVLKVIYVGGMALDTTAFVAAYPDISRAVEMQVSHAFRRREDLGGVTWNAGGVGSSSIGEYDLLDTVMATLDHHKRATAWA